MKVITQLRALWPAVLRRAKQYPNNVLSAGILVFVLTSAGLAYYLANLELKVPPPESVKTTVRSGTPQSIQEPGAAAKPASPTSPTKAPVATAPHKGQYGFSAGDLHELPAAELEARLTDFNAIGVSWIRFDVQWNDVQSGGPTSYDWSSYDRVVAGANKHKLKVLMLLDYTPSWARRSDCASDYHCAPNDNAQFAQYAAEAVKRYAPLGVKNWEIWNEPNHVGAWEPAPDAAAYTDLLIKSYAAIKKADPAAFVITGGTGVTYTENGNIGPADWLAAVYKYGGKNSFNGVGQHPYTYPALATLNEEWTGWYQMLAVRSVMAANGDGSKPVWLTEYGAPTSGPGALATQQNFNFEHNPDHVDEALQNEMIKVAFSLHKGYSWVGPLFIYGYKDLGTDHSSNENFFGLLRADGSQKPAYATFKSLLR